MGWPPDTKSGVPGSIPGHVEVFFHFFGDVLGCVWEYFGSVFGWSGQEKNAENRDHSILKIIFFRNIWEHLSCIGGL